MIGGIFMQNLKPPLDRRRKPDIVIRLVNAISIVGWMMINLCTLLTINSKPEQTNMFYKMFNIPVRDYWDFSLLSIVFFLLMFLFAVALIGILLNATRQRRKTDKMNKSLIFQAAMAVLGMLLLWVNSIV